MPTAVARYATRAELVLHAVEDITQQIEQCVRAFDRPIHVALTGGSVGIEVLAGLRHTSDRLDWQRIHVWWGDERFLAFDDAERNDVQAIAALLAHVAIPSENIHRYGAPPQSMESARQDYENQLQAHGLSLTGERGFDLVLLGMGPDGHVASLFPGHAALSETRRSVVIELASPKPPARRLSLSLALLNQSEQVWIMVSGADKASAVSRLLSREQQIPAARLSPLHPLRLYADTAALGITD